MGVSKKAHSTVLRLDTKGAGGRERRLRRSRSLWIEEDLVRVSIGGSLLPRMPLHFNPVPSVRHRRESPCKSRYRFYRPPPPPLSVLARHTRVASTGFYYERESGVREYISRARSRYRINDIPRIPSDNRHVSLSRGLQPARVMNRTAESFHFSRAARTALRPMRLPLLPNGRCL